MKTHEIKMTIDAGGSVYWKQDNYHVIKDNNGDYFIKCINNGHSIGLTHKDGFTLNGDEADFYWFRNGNYSNWKTQ